MTTVTQLNSTPHPAACLISQLTICTTPIAWFQELSSSGVVDACTGRRTSVQGGRRGAAAHLLVGAAAAEAGRRREEDSERAVRLAASEFQFREEGGHNRARRRQGRRRRPPPALVRQQLSPSQPRTRPGPRAPCFSFRHWAHGDHWAASWASKPIRPTTSPPSARIPPLVPDPPATVIPGVDGK